MEWSQPITSLVYKGGQRNPYEGFHFLYWRFLMNRTKETKVISIPPPPTKRLWPYILQSVCSLLRISTRAILLSLNDRHRARVNCNDDIII